MGVTQEKTLKEFKMRILVSIARNVYMGLAIENDIPSFDSQECLFDFSTAYTIKWLKPLVYVVFNTTKKLVFIGVKMFKLVFTYVNIITGAFIFNSQF